MSHPGIALSRPRIVHPLPGGTLVRRWCVAFVMACMPTTAATSVSAQTLTFRRDIPPVRWEGCASYLGVRAAMPALPRAVQVVAVSDSASIHAERLAADATEATVLGNSQVALQLLTRAATLNPSSPVISYRRARALDEMGDTDSAIREYCRYTTLRDADDRENVMLRLAELAATDEADGAVSPAAARAFIAGLTHADNGRMSDAEREFTTALDAAPGWGDAWYNRALSRIANGEHAGAAQDLRRYAVLQPVADAARTAHTQALIETLETPLYSPTATLAAGVAVPGLGHFTTGRPVAGLVVLGSAATALAAGLLIERTDVACLALPVNGRCPPDQVLREDTDRPYLTAALGVAVAIGIGGAIEAWHSVRERNEHADEVLRIGGMAARLEFPAVYADAAGADVALIRLRF